MTAPTPGELDIEDRSAAPSLAVITKARAILSDPKRWTRGYYAREENGEMCPSKSAKAFCFCSIGAIYRASHDLGMTVDLGILRLLERQMGGNIARFNDAAKRRHDDILLAFDRAIAALSQGAQAPVVHTKANSNG